MTALFISHSSRDLGLVDDLRERLRAKGFTALFLDIDEQDGIPAGRDWERELYTALRRCDGVVFLATESSVASRWCFAELALARSLGTPIFVLRATPGAKLDLLQDIQWIDLADGDAAYQRLWHGLVRAGLSAVDSLSWDPTRSPYPGLRAFAADDAAVFFGRGEEIRRLTTLVQPTLNLGGRWVSIVGPSGSGKSSLLHAGLLPRLARMPDKWVVVPPFVPGTQPVRRLATSLARAYQAAGRERDADDLEAVLTSSDGSATLVDAVRDLSEIGGLTTASVLVSIDQAEELITRTGPREQQAFLDLLGQAIGEHSPLWVVCTLRSEFLSTAPERAGLGEITDDSPVLEPLSRARLSEVIALPARRAGLQFDPGLIERMVEETTGGDALPLLGHTLFELAKMAGETGTIRREHYESLGGVVGALQRRADQVMAELNARGYGHDVLPLLLKLVTVDAGGQFVRRRLGHAALTERELTVVDHFVDARLLSSDRSEQNGQHGTGTPDATVEVTHEALLRQWPPLHQAILDAETGLRMRAELEHEAADWMHADRDQAYLLRGGRLTAFDEWLERDAVQLADRERQFIEASRELATAELRAVRRSNQRLRNLLIGVAFLLVVSVVAGAIALSQRQKAELQARNALTRQLMAQSSALRSTQPDVALLLGVEALNRAPAGLSDDARVSLFRALNGQFHVTRLYQALPAGARSVAYSKDGDLLASAGDDHAVTLWDTATGRRRGEPLQGHTDGVHSVAFSPTENLLASAGADGSIRLWDVATGRPHGPPLVTSDPKPVSAVTFSPDGSLLASAGEDGTVRLWDVATARQSGQPLVDEGDSAVKFWRVTFSPDGTKLAATGSDGSVRLWNPKTRQVLSTGIHAHIGWAVGVAFSRDSSRLATGGEDGTVKIWDSATGGQIGEPLAGHSGEVTYLDFSPVGPLLASAGRDGTVRLWDTQTLRPHGGPFAGHANAVRCVVFNRDGTALASASYDGTLRVWDVAPTQPVGRALAGHEGKVTDLAVEARSGRLASGSDAGVIRIWDTPNDPRNAPRELKGHKGWVMALAFDPSGELLASAGADWTVRLWDVRSGQPRVEPLLGHSDEVTGVFFSPNGVYLVSTSKDRTVRLWRSDDGQPVGEPMFTGAEATAATFVTRDSLLAVGIDGTIRMWDIDPATLIEAACATANRNLSAPEWMRLMGKQSAYRETCQLRSSTR